MTVSRPVMVLLATLAVGACSRRAGGPDVANARRELAELVKVYEEASNQGDAHELAALYGEEALLLPPDGGIVAGRDSIADFWRDGLERGLTLDTVRVVARAGRFRGGHLPRGANRPGRRRLREVRDVLCAR
jgi:hypothetical protein